MINNITIKGRLAESPEKRLTNSGIPVASFTVAVTGRKPKDGEAPTYWIDCIAWRGLADFVDRYFSKGQEIAVSGWLQTRVYEDKSGNKRKATEIVAENVDFCGSKHDNPVRQNSNTGANIGAGFNVNDYVEIDDDSSGLPF